MRNPPVGRLALVGLVFLACDPSTTNDDGAGGVSNAGAAPLGGAVTGGAGQGGDDAGGGGGALPLGGAGGDGGTGGSGPDPACTGIPDYEPAPAELQTPFDCMVVICAGGQLTDFDDSDDPPPDNPTDCVHPYCDEGTLVFTPALAGEECSASGGTVCDGAGACVECIVAESCPTSSSACEEPVCDLGACSIAPVSSGSAVASCFPYACDGTSPDCPTTCVTDDDCAAQTCIGGICQPIEPCDLEWVTTVSEPCGASNLMIAGFPRTVHVDGSISVASLLTPNWSVKRYNSDGVLQGQFLTAIIEMGFCNFAFGPLGGWVRHCEWDYGVGAAASVRSSEYNWADGYSAGAFTMSASASVDGVNNVFFDAQASYLGSPPTTYHSVHTVDGVVLPGSTSYVQPRPAQTLPPGLATSALSQLTSYDTHVDWSGNVSVTGAAIGPVDFGDGPMTPVSSTDVIVAKFNASGALLWAHRYAATDATPQLVENEWGADDGSLIAIGDFTSADFGYGPMTPPQPGSRFLVKHGPNGEPVCARTVVADVAYQGPSGEVVLGRASGPIVVDEATVGNGPYQCVSGVTSVTAATIGRLAP
jgi:hypothetical protein